MSDKATTLLDIGDLTEDVTIGKVTISMQGLTAGDIFGFLVRYPVLQTILDKKDPEGKIKFTNEDLFNIAPQAVYEAVAMCDVNLPRDAADRIPPKVLKQAARRVEKLSISYQLLLVNKFFDLTFSDGVGPFVEAWIALMGRFQQLQEGAAAVSAESSQEQLGEPAFTVDTPYKRRGVSRLVN